MHHILYVYYLILKYQHIMSFYHQANHDIWFTNYCGEKQFCVSLKPLKSARLIWICSISLFTDIIYSHFQNLSFFVLYLRDQLSVIIINIQLKTHTKNTIVNYKFISYLKFTKLKMYLRNFIHLMTGFELNQF